MTSETLPLASNPKPDPTDLPPRRTSRVAIGIGVTLGSLGALYGAFWLADLASVSSQTTESTYDAAATVELVADGNVTVTVGDDGSGVEVQWLDRSGLSGPIHDVDEGSDQLVVSSQCTGWLRAMCRGSLDVQLPAETELVVRTSNGEIFATGVIGGADLVTSNGMITLDTMAGNVRAETSNGHIGARDLDGSLDAETSNGEIDVAGVEGNVDVSTSNGRVHIGDVNGDVEARSSNGSITVLGGTEPVALTLETSNGQRVVEGATDPGAERQVYAKTSNGDVAYYGSSRS